MAYTVSPSPLFVRTLRIPTAVRPHRLPPTSRVQHLQHLELTLKSVLRPSTLRRRRHCRKMATMMRCLCWIVPQRVIMTMALLREKVVQ